MSVELGHKDRLLIVTHNCDEDAHAIILPIRRPQPI